MIIVNHEFREVYICNKKVADKAIKFLTGEGNEISVAKRIPKGYDIVNLIDVSLTDSHYGFLVIK